MEEWTTELREHLAARRKQPRDDLLSVLLAARTSDGALREHELLAMATLLLFSAQETTVDLIGNGVLALLRHPLQRRALAQDPSLMPAALEEMLRFDAPVQAAVTRTASCDLELGGKTIRAGDNVSVMLGSANHDPQVFQDPQHFDIARHHGRNSVVFGLGVHACLGAHLARLEARIAITRLLRRVPGLELASAPPRWRTNVAFRGLEVLPVRC
jgi:cytochrome P450